MIHGLDLFSGIGGIGLALKEFGVTTVAYCEADKYAQGVLLSRMQSGELDKAPIWDDVRTLKAEMLPEIDIIYGGFPCQDISIAGLGKGLDGERSGLFFEIVRLTKETGARFVFLENVPAIRTRGLQEVVTVFTKMGYDCRWSCVSAAEVGALHKRERWFLLAKEKHLANASSKGLEKHSRGEIQTAQRQFKFTEESLFDRKEWEIEPTVGRVANGIQNRVDRIKCLGNSVVPEQVKEAFSRLIGRSSQTVLPEES